MTFRQLAVFNVLRNKRTYAAYFFSSALSVMVFFIYTLFIFHPDIDEGLAGEIAIKGMKAAEYLTYGFCFFFILYSVRAFLAARRLEFGIFLVHGISRRKLYLLLFLENMLVGFAAILAGLAAGIIFAKLFLMIGARAMNFADLSFYFSWEALGLTAIAFVFLFLLISVISPIFIQGERIVDLLKGTAKPQKEPKDSFLASFFTLTALAVAYYLAATTNGGNVEKRIIMIIPLVIIATYFLFTQFSISLIYVLKKRRKFYRRKTHMLLLSELAFKMKENAGMFFFITIVSTVSFCAVGSFSATTTLDNKTSIEYPFGISYVSLAGDNSKRENLAAIEKELAQTGLAFNKTELELDREISAQTGLPITLVSQTGYNRFAAVLGYPTLSLERDEAKFVPVSLQQKKSLSEVDRQPVTLMESEQQLIITGAASQIFYKFSVGSNVLVVPDEVYQAASRFSLATRGRYEEATYTGYKVEDWRKTKDIGIWLAFEDDENASYKFASSGRQYALTKQTYNILLFISILTGSVFFIAAGSILYFRLYKELGRDRNRYQTVARMGLTEKELKQIVTIQLTFLFFSPMAVAVMHSAFAFIALQNLFDLSILSETISVLLVFILAQAVYFFTIRIFYLKQLKKSNSNEVF